MTSNRIIIMLLGLVLCVTVYGQIQFLDNTEYYEVEGNGDTRGVAFFDYNNDGLEDIFVVIGETNISNILYKNIPGVEPFLNVTSEANLTLNVQGYAISTGDYNNDGWQDIFTSYHGNDDNQIYKNLGGAPVSYTQLAAAISGDMDNAGTTWLDYNGDGLLDLFLMDHHGIWVPGNGDGFGYIQILGMIHFSSMVHLILKVQDNV